MKRKAPEETTVLLVEDDPNAMDIYRTVLEYDGYRVITATDGREGVRKATEAEPDLIVMDMSMAGLDGWQATQLLREDPRTVSIPVLALTAHARVEDRERAHGAGCDGYLSKPVEPRAVVLEIERLLSRGG